MSFSTTQSSQIPTQELRSAPVSPVGPFILCPLLPGDRVFLIYQFTIGTFISFWSEWVQSVLSKDWEKVDLLPFDSV